MKEPSIEQIRAFQLHAHHLDAFYDKSKLIEIAGACGLQNTPPGAWENALYHRVANLSVLEMQEILYEKKELVQAWSIRGLPMVFPVSESDVFLSALCPEDEEPWIYTKGIELALDALDMELEALLALLEKAINRLEDHVISTKSALDQCLAEWMLPDIPKEKQKIWNQPSMYGNDKVQTVGGAVVSFLLRPCAMQGRVVFARRCGSHPSFTTYRSWLMKEMQVREEAQKELVRKFLHCYGPAVLKSFQTWMGCSRKQAERLWNLIKDEIEPVMVMGRKSFILRKDMDQLFVPACFSRELVLLHGHDPYLDQRNRSLLQIEKSLHPQIWRMVANPGAVVFRGEIIGIWTCRKQGESMCVKVTLWKHQEVKNRIQTQVEAYAEFRHFTLKCLDF